MQKIKMIVFVLLLLLPFIQRAQNNKSKGMHSDKPADRWQDALISGNGEMGVLVFGQPAEESIIFNHEFCYEFVGTEDIEPPKIGKYLPEIREKMRKGDYDDATKFAYEVAKKEGYEGLKWTDPYHPAMLMKINQKNNGSISDYQRSTNFETGEIEVSWTSDEAHWHRKTFVSRANNIVVQKIAGSKKVTLDVSADMLKPKIVGQQSKYGKTLRIKPTELAADSNWIVMRQAYELYGRGYEVVNRVINKGGEKKKEGNKIVVIDADEVLIISRIVFLDEYDKSQVVQTKKALENLKDNYDDLLDSHSAIHSEMFNRVRLDLASEKNSSLSSEASIKAQMANQQELNLELIQSMFDMGRYALISSSGKNPPNLMGIWNGEWRPAWSGDFTTDANVNLQIASAAIADLPEAIDSYMTMLERVMDDWETNAMNLYGVKGYLAGTRTSGKRNLHTHFNVSFPGEFWLAGAEWLLLPCYEYYLVSGDEAFLKERLLPAMKKTVLFFEDFLSDKDQHGNFVFAPSYSPENSPANIKLQGSANATMDIAAAKEAVRHLIDIAEKHQLEDVDLDKLRMMLNKMPPYLLNKDGALKEWAIDDLDDFYDHRHISHLYPVWPGFEINPEETPEMFEAATIAFAKKGRGNNSAHGLMHGALIAARLKEADKVYKNLLFMLTNNYVFSSLFTSHNPNLEIYNADALNSLPAAVIEMLVYSRPGVIELLPACSDKINTGKITGVKCRTQATVESLEWDFERGVVTATISSQIDQDIELIFRRPTQSIKDSKGNELKESSKISRSLELKKGEKKELVVRF